MQVDVITMRGTRPDARRLVRYRTLLHALAGNQSCQRWTTCHQHEQTYESVHRLHASVRVQVCVPSGRRKSNPLRDARPLHHPVLEATIHRQGVRLWMRSTPRVHSYKDRSDGPCGQDATHPGNGLIRPRSPQSSAPVPHQSDSPCTAWSANPWSSIMLAADCTVSDRWSPVTDFSVGGCCSTVAVRPD